MKIDVVFPDEIPEHEIHELLRLLSYFGISFSIEN